MRSFNGGSAVDWRHGSGLASDGRFAANEVYPLQGRSFALLIQVRATE